MGQIISVITNPDDPYRDDRQQAYEADRRAQYDRCQDQLRRGAVEAAWGNRANGVNQVIDAWGGRDCNPGPYVPPSQQPARPTSPRLQLQQPGDLKYGGR